MVAKKHYNKINEPIRVSLVFFEINFLELAMVTLSIFVLLVILGFVNVYADVLGWKSFLMLVALYVPLIRLLIFGNKQDHPSFLLSLISFKFFQPRRITHLNPKPNYERRPV